MAILQGGRREHCLPTPHRHKRIRPRHCLSAEGVPGERGGFIPTLNLCVLNPEMEEKVAIPIAIDIYQGGLHHRSLMAMFPKTGCVRIQRASVEVGIRENGHGDDAVTARIEAVRKVIGLDIDEYLYGT
jgi:hypothetical protein